MLREDVEDEPGAVDDLHLHDVLEMPQLPGAQLAVADDGVRATGDDEVPQLTRLARADIGRRVGPVTPLDDAIEHQCSRRLREGGQLTQAALGLLRRALGPHADQHDLLEADLAVLDLGDVLEFGGEADDATQRLPILKVEFADRWLV